MEGGKRHVTQCFLMANTVNHLISFNLFLSRCFAYVKYGIASMDCKSRKISKQFDGSLLYFILALGVFLEVMPVCYSHKAASSTNLWKHVQSCCFAGQVVYDGGCKIVN